MNANTARDTPGARWAADLPDRSLHGKPLKQAFRGCKVGTETLAGEAGSDYFTGVATKTLGVTGSVLGGAVKWKPLQPVLNTVRGVLLTLYLLGRGVVAGSRTGNFLVALVLALGGALIGLSLLGVDVPGLLTLLGATLLIAGVLLGVVRGTGWRIAWLVGLYAATVAAVLRRAHVGRPAVVGRSGRGDGGDRAARGGCHRAGLRCPALPPETALALVQIPLSRSPIAAMPRSIAASLRLPKPRTSSGG